ncbi:serine-rich adhesin for platelets-like [Watersipora subatra]|uniref:serine-rich adhesin for platelets-like n=1 Tax=Watersipora subatra TaxID=2589382 RepID=UPI00355AE25F
MVINFMKAKEKENSNRTVAQSDTAARDDYGFLDSARQQDKKVIPNGHSYTTKNARNRSTSRSDAAVYKRPQASPHRSTDRGRSRADPLEFYSQVAERRSRSTSRASRQTENYSTTQKVGRTDRSRSKSRDIVTLYTSSNAQARCRSATPVGSLRSYIYVPPSNTSNHSTMTLPKSQASTNFDICPISAHGSRQADQSMRSRSLVREPTDRDSTLKSTCSSYTPRAKSESRSSSVMRDAISLCSNFSTQSRALSNSEIVSQNLELWISTTSKNQRLRSKSRERKKEETKTKFVTLLEMDERANVQNEKQLNDANSVNPTNIKMMAIAGHTPSNNWESNDELKVRPGDLITGHYKQNEWLYASLSDSSSGYVPYAYTKAIKITSLDKSSTLPLDKGRSTTAKLNYSETELSDQKHRGHDRISDIDYPNVEHKPYRDSLSSTNSAFLEEIMCIRPAGVPRNLRQPREFADCLVVDADNNSELNEDIKVCSDSGISEPNSNHSDEMDPYVSLANSRLRQDSNPVPAGSRSSVASSNPQEDCRARRMCKNFGHSGQEGRANQRHVTQQIDFMPLGLLGERLQQPVSPYGTYFTPNYSYAQPNYHNISQDMHARAQPVMDIPSECKPQIPRDYNGPRARVAYDYMGMLEDDVVVKAGEVVTVLNFEDIEWIWVMRKDGVEGFMPREYVISPELSMLSERSGAQQHMLVTL